MVMSYSSIAKGSADTPKVISIASPASAGASKAEESSQSPATPSSDAPSVQPEGVAGPSTAGPSTTTQSRTAEDHNADNIKTSESSASSSKSPVQHLVLDAGPLLSLTPLRHLATSFHTTPAVLAELRDPRSREHWERLGLSGVNVKVENPSADAMARGEWCDSGFQSQDLDDAPVCLALPSRSSASLGFEIESAR